MMTSNHRVPSIEITRTLPKAQRLARSQEHSSQPTQIVAHDDSRGTDTAESRIPEPNEDSPHVLITLALEEDQKLDVHAWEQWLNAFPAMAKYAKVQGVFKSHSTLLLVSIPVSIWDVLPEDPATSFVAFIRSDNLIKERDVSSSRITPIAGRSETCVKVSKPSIARHSGERASDADDRRLFKSKFAGY